MKGLKMNKNGIKKQARNIINGVLIYFLLMSLTGCAQTEIYEIPTLISPPESLLSKTEFTCTPKTNGELWDCYLKLIDSLNVCNNDKKAILEFYGKPD